MNVLLLQYSNCQFCLGPEDFKTARKEKNIKLLLKGQFWQENMTDI